MYRLDLPKEAKKELYRQYVYGNIRTVGYTHKNKIYLYGFDNDIELWIHTLIHENYHIILDNLNISENYHHKIIEYLPNLKINGYEH